MRCKNCGYVAIRGGKVVITSFQEHVLLICALHLDFKIWVWKLLLCPQASLKNPGSNKSCVIEKVHVVIKITIVSRAVGGFWVADELTS